MSEERSYTAFAGDMRIASGDVRTMLARVKACVDSGEERTLLIFEDQTGIQIDFNLRGSLEEVLAGLEYHPHFASQASPSDKKPGPGRPSLGVVSREVSLLPRHWEWLGRQPSGASAALRRLVDEARKRDMGPDRAKQARDAAAKFMWTMAGDRQGFEEASRALFSGDYERFDTLVLPWPEDIRDHLCNLVDEIKKWENRARV